MSSSVLCLNACSTPLKWIEWQRAVCMVVADQAEIIETVEGEQVRSEYLTIPMPKTVMLRAYVYVPHVGHGGDAVQRATRRAILVRDGQKCGYCGNHAETIDHIFPKSRGGEDTWQNLISACLPCNQRKRDRTPEEAGFKMLWPPRYVDLRIAVRRSATTRRGG